MPDSRLFYRPLKQALRVLMPITFLAATLLIAGCSNLGVKPWERDLLANPDMHFSWT